MFKKGDIVNMKECFSNLSFYTNENLIVMKGIKDYVFVYGKNYNTYLWDEYLELNPITIRNRKIQKILSNLNK